MSTKHVEGISLIAYPRQLKAATHKTIDILRRKCQTLSGQVETLEQENFALNHKLKLYRQRAESLIEVLYGK